MDFRRVLQALLKGFEERRIRYGILGGFALAVLGVPRLTKDLDLALHADDLDALHELLTQLGYTLTARTSNVSHYSHPESVWGKVDVLHASRSYSQAMIERAQSHGVFDGEFQVKILQPEDVIGFKVQAIVNNPLRAVRDNLDIEALMGHYRAKLDWERIQEYYDLFEQTEQGRALRARYGHAE
jgi:hypothetical protein